VLNISHTLQDSDIVKVCAIICKMLNYSLPRLYVHGDGGKAPRILKFGAHPASCTMGTGSFPGVKSDQGVTLTPHPLLVPWS